MAAGISTGIKTKVYAKLSPSDDDKTIDDAGKVAAVAADANLLGSVIEVGAMSLDANTIRYGVYGEGSDRSLAGQSSLGDFTVTFAYDRTAALNKSLADTDIGKEIVVVLETLTGSKKTYDSVSGEVAGISKERPLDAASQVTLTIAMKKAPKTLDEA